jgi:YD repeat-containing protein
LYETENDLGEIIRYELDAAGNRDEILYKQDQSTVVQSVDYDFDGLSRLWKQFGSYGQQTSNTYDEKDHLTTIDDGVNPPVLQDFDGQNRLKQTTDADGEDLFINYDAQDRIERVTDQRGLITDYVYDGFGNLQTLISPDTGTTTYNYDPAGNRSRQTDARGIVTNYTYDALNRLKTVVYADASRNTTYTYDNWVFGALGCSTCDGRLSRLEDASGQTAYIYDTLGRMDVRINTVNVPDGAPVNLTTDFDFNDAGRLERVQYPNGQAVTYDFDAAGQVDGLSYKAQDRNDPLVMVDKNIATNITYQPFGPMKGVSYGNNLQLNRVYDLDGRLDTQSVSGVQSLDYNYDGANNLDGIDNLIDDSRDETFTYDNLNRLDTASGKYGDLDYDYDEVGNREKRTIGRDTTIIEDHQISPASNRLDWIYIIEGAANTTREFVYDAAGNLVEEKRADGTYMKPVYDDTNRMESVSQ